MTVDELIATGDLAGAFGASKDQVRRKPEEAEFRFTLFGLYCIAGDWVRALTQIDVMERLRPSDAMAALNYRVLVGAETFRESVIAGLKTPMVLGEPEEWIALLLEALAAGPGKNSRGREFRARALELAPKVPGTIGGEPFDWIADSDERFGPVLEAVVEGKYYWIPFDRIESMTSELPNQLLDLVWQQVELKLRNAGTVAAFVPVRYPFAGTATPDEHRLARRTDWQEQDDGAMIGIGQRTLATSVADYGLLDTRSLRLQPA